MVGRTFEPMYAATANLRQPSEGNSLWLVFNLPYQDLRERLSEPESRILFKRLMHQIRAQFLSAYAEHV